LLLDRGETTFLGFRIGIEGDGQALWDAIAANWYSLSSLLDLYSGYIAAVPRMHLEDRALTRALADVIDGLFRSDRRAHFGGAALPSRSPVRIAVLPAIGSLGTIRALGVPP
jgi:hypothetical protein